MKVNTKRNAEPEVEIDSDSQSVGRDPLVGREQILSGSRKTLNYRLPENHYFCLVSHSTPMLWVLAYPQRRMNN
ncbi:hypothetical protein T11_13196 [Trichinella zimbabwensis]|uniref:Uncharacterized protein n=1 Tax=Trichinella zimbabwensis TaxID=268475 RepID=A0A0V1GZM8_9BILA|nr:hypothetical protein T11_13196 [Trichinella zimbabwensis]